jgi:predicted nucleic acid-binding protein
VALARPKEVTLYALDAAEVGWDAWNTHQATEMARQTANAASPILGGNERMNDMQLQIYSFEMGLHDSSFD